MKPHVTYSYQLAQKKWRKKMTYSNQSPKPQIHFLTCKKTSIRGG